MSVGYGLLIVGILIMFFSLFQVYRVFTKKQPPVQFFHFEGVKIDLSKLMPQADTGVTDSIAKQFNIQIPKTQKTVQPMETEIISAAMLNDSANLGATVFLMSFVLNFGSKLASIGVSLATKK